MQRCSPRFKSKLHVGWAPTWRPEPTETSVTELRYDSVNSTLKELINVKAIFFLIQ